MEQDEKATAPATPDQPQTPAPPNRGKARIRVEVEFDLDDASVFNLRGEGIKTTTVVEN